MNYKEICEAVNFKFFQILNEKTSVDSLKTLDKLISLIINDSNNNNLEKKSYNFSDKNVSVEIKVFFNRKDYYGEYIPWYKSIDIYLPTKPTWKSTKSIVSHELIHLMDDLRVKQHTKETRYGKKLPKMGYDFVPNGGYETIKSNCPITKTLNNILYRLWSRTERNAFISLSYINDIKICKEYINDIKEQIDEVEQSDNVENWECWVELNRELFYQKEIKFLAPHRNFDNDINVKRCKKYFIRKSRYLLKDFSKKLLKNCMNNIYKTSTNKNVGI